MFFQSTKQYIVVITAASRYAIDLWKAFAALKWWIVLDLKLEVIGELLKHINQALKNFLSKNYRYLGY